MIIVCGLYLLQNQNLKEDTSVTPMITNEPLTDSPPPILDPTDAPPKDLDTTSFSTTIMILTILGGVFFAVSFLIILLGGTQEFSIAGTRMFPLPAVAFGLFAVSLGLTLSKDDPNKVYVIISIIGLILSLFLIMALCIRPSQEKPSQEKPSDLQTHLRDSSNFLKGNPPVNAPTITAPVTIASTNTAPVTDASTNTDPVTDASKNTSSSKSTNFLRRLFKTPTSANYARLKNSTKRFAWGSGFYG